MNAEVKEKWLEALRSGDFGQAQRQLRDERPDGTNGYCCLGVLCEVYRRETGRGGWNGTMFEDAHGAEEEYHLPPDVMTWSGLDGNGTFDDPEAVDIRFPLTTEVETENIEYASSLVHLNDDLQYDFRQIADVIERHF